MNPSIESRLESIAQRCDQVMVTIRGIRARTPAVGEDAAKDVVSGVLGQIASDLFDAPSLRKPVKKYSKKFLDSQDRLSRSNLLAQCETTFNSLLIEAKDFLSNISFVSKGLTSSGNSSILIAKIEGCQKYSSLEARTRHLALDLRHLKSKALLLNSEIPPFVERTFEDKTKVTDYAILKSFERVARSLIESKLKPLSANWWKERIPDDVRRRAEERKTKNESPYPWVKSRDLHPIHYVDFSDYGKIITRKDNWTQAFQSIYKHKTSVEVKSRELEPIRNSIAHSREISKEESDKLRLYTKELTQLS